MSKAICSSVRQFCQENTIGEGECEALNKGNKEAMNGCPDLSGIIYINTSIIRRLIMKRKFAMYVMLTLTVLAVAAFISTAMGQPGEGGFGGFGRGGGQPADNALNAIAGPDRVVMSGGKTYLNGFAGYGSGARGGRGGGRRGGGAATAAVDANRPPVRALWTKESGPGTVNFENAEAAVTTTTFSELGTYVLKLTANNGQTTASSTLSVTVETPHRRQSSNLFIPKTTR